MNLTIKRLVLLNVTVAPPANSSTGPKLLPLGLFAAPVSYLSLQDVRFSVPVLIFQQYLSLFQKDLFTVKSKKDGGVGMHTVSICSAAVSPPCKCCGRHEASSHPSRAFTASCWSRLVFQDGSGQLLVHCTTCVAKSFKAAVHAPVCCSAAVQDGTSFLNIPFWSDAYTELTTVTILTGPCIIPSRIYSQPLPTILASMGDTPGCNARSVNNDTLIPILQRDATINTTVPLLIRLVTNVTLGTNLPHPIVFARPVLLVGSSSSPVSVDLQMVVNQLNVTRRNAQLAWQAVVLENMAPGVLGVLQQQHCFFPDENVSDKDFGKVVFTCIVLAYSACFQPSRHGVDFAVEERMGGAQHGWNYQQLLVACAWQDMESCMEFMCLSVGRGSRGKRHNDEQTQRHRSAVGQTQTAHVPYLRTPVLT
jgi:hypothetical protein